MNDPATAITDAAEVLPAAFQYDDDKQSIVVEQRYSEAQSLMRQGLANMIEAGGKFGEIRDLLRHNKNGGFDAWIAAKNMERRTVYRIMDLHRAFATVPNLSQLDVTASAAYLLAASSVPEEARREAVQRAEAGEKIGVATAKDIIDRQYASIPELVPGVRAWLASVPSYRNNLTAQRDVLIQIKIQSPAGREHLGKLMQFPDLAQPHRASDVVAACRHAFDDINAESMARVATVVITDPAPESTIRAPIYDLERRLDAWLKQLCATTGEERVILEDIRNKRDPWYTRVFNAPTLPDNRTNGDVLQAAHNLLDHLNQTAERSASSHTVTTTSATSTGSLAGPTTGHCSRCGRHLTDPVHIAAGCGPKCAAKANGGSNGHITAQPLPTGAAIEPEPIDLSAIVDSWLARKVEENDLPDEREAFRFVLQQIIANRATGGAAEIWKDLRTFEKWPPNTSNDAKLDACRTVLARLTGRPVDPVPAAAPAPQVLPPIDLEGTPAERNQRRIRQLERALADLIEFVLGQPVSPDLEAETHAALQAANLALHDVTNA